MSKDENSQHPSDANERQPYCLRLPGFITDEQVGLGDVIKRTTSTRHIMVVPPLLNAWAAYQALARSHPANAVNRALTSIKSAVSTPRQTSHRS